MSSNSTNIDNIADNVGTRGKEETDRLSLFLNGQYFSSPAYQHCQRTGGAQ